LEVCESRDPKGLYKKARNGEIPHFTGIDDPYEVPEQPDLALKTGQLSPSQCADKILTELHNRKLFTS